jgi:four helix bundle protein
MKDAATNAPRDMQERAMEYALRVIRLYRHLQKQKDGAGWVIGKQLLRSATSIGANISEAKSGESRADFVHKYSIAQKEARESFYWLTLLLKSESLEASRLQPLLDESNELIAIITRIIVNTKKNGV